MRSQPAIRRRLPVRYCRSRPGPSRRLSAREDGFHQVDIPRPWRKEPQVLEQRVRSRAAEFVGNLAFAKRSGQTRREEIADAGGREVRPGYSTTRMPLCWRVVRGRSCAIRSCGSAARSLSSKTSCDRECIELSFLDPHSFHSSVLQQAPRILTPQRIKNHSRIITGMGTPISQRSTLRPTMFLLGGALKRTAGFLAQAAFRLIACFASWLSRSSVFFSSCSVLSSSSATSRSPSCEAQVLSVP